MTDDVKQHVFQYVDSKDQVLRTVGLKLWQNPEIGLQEIFAHQLLTETLEEEGFQVTRKFVVETGFKAEFQTAEKPHIMILCEYDALPNIGHACGHNLIAEAGVGAAFGLKHAMERYGVKCKLTVLGTPAEENFGSKITMIEKGVLENVDAALMVHPREMNSFHMPHYGLKDIDIKFIGTSAHATGSPWEGKNALDAAILAYQGIACFRKQMKQNWHINANIKLSADAVIGIIPNSAQMEADIRCGDMSDMDELFRRVKQICEGAAMMADCKVNIETFDEVYSSLVSNKTLLQCYKTNATPFQLKFQDIQRSGGSTDMGNVSMEVPSIHPVFYIGCPYGPHTDSFTQYSGLEEAHRSTMIQSKILAATAIDLAKDGAILEAAKKEFRERKKNCFPEETFQEFY